MSNHTAGPWRYWTQKRTAGEDTCTFQNLNGEEVLRAVTVTLAEADARLIAAAPELLAALRDVIGWVPGAAAWHTVAPLKAVEQARLAIFKATGEIS